MGVRGILTDTMKKEPRTEAEIEKHYDEKLVNDLIGGLASGKIGGMDFIEKVAALKKEKDTAVLVEAREIPKLRAPKAVAVSPCGISRQGMN